MPRSAAIAAGGHGITVTWDADPVTGRRHESRFSSGFLRRAAYMPAGGASASSAATAAGGASLASRPDFVRARHATFPEGTRLWDAGMSKAVPSFSAEHTATQAGFAEAIGALWRDGFLLVTGMPRDMAGTRAWAERIGTVRPTFYGEMWGTKPVVRRPPAWRPPVRAAHLSRRPRTRARARAQPVDGDGPIDTAFTNMELLPHTDGTYWRDAPGLQIFNCVEQSSQGGGTWLVDGFKASRPPLLAGVCAPAITRPRATGRVGAAELGPGGLQLPGSHASAVAPYGRRGRAGAAR